MEVDNDDKMEIDHDDVASKAGERPRKKRRQKPSSSSASQSSSPTPARKSAAHRKKPSSSASQSSSSTSTSKRAEGVHNAASDADDERGDAEVLARDRCFPEEQTSARFDLLKKKPSAATDASIDAGINVAEVESSVLAEVFERRKQEERAAALAKVYSGATEKDDDGEDCYVVPLPGTSVSCRVRKRDAARRYTLHPRPKPKKLKEKSLMAASARSFRKSAEETSSSPTETGLSSSATKGGKKTSTPAPKRRKTTSSKTDDEDFVPDDDGDNDAEPGPSTRQPSSAPKKQAKGKKEASTEKESPSSPKRKSGHEADDEVDDQEDVVAQDRRSQERASAMWDLITGVRWSTPLSTAIEADEAAAAVESSILIEVFQRRAEEARQAEMAKAPASASWYDVRIPGTRVTFRKYRDGRCQYTRAPRLKPKSLTEKSLLAASARSFRDHADGKSSLRGKLSASINNQATLKRMAVVFTGLWQEMDARLVKGEEVDKKVFDRHDDDCVDSLLASDRPSACRQLRRYCKALVSTRRSQMGSKL